MNKKGRRFEMRCEEGFLAAIDDWRALQRPVPSQAAAIRRLAMRGAVLDQFLDVILRESVSELNRANRFDAELESGTYGRWKDVIVQALDHTARQELRARAENLDFRQPSDATTDEAPEKPSQDRFSTKRLREIR